MSARKNATPTSRLEVARRLRELADELGTLGDVVAARRYPIPRRRRFDAADSAKSAAATARWAAFALDRDETNRSRRFVKP
ncbi:MAG: hypothetical protein DCC71_15380 [Proteobacteria bacterium]|nr:MAG: hypothetical protein DCC71_15380 [Pseudomonadota bacterium]